MKNNVSVVQLIWLILINCNSKIAVHKISFFPSWQFDNYLGDSEDEEENADTKVFISIKRNKFKYLTLYTVCVDYSGLDAHLESLFTFLQILFSCKAHQFLSSFSYLTTASNGIGSINKFI